MKIKTSRLIKGQGVLVGFESLDEDIGLGDTLVHEELAWRVIDVQRKVGKLLLDGKGGIPAPGLEVRVVKPDLLDQPLKSITLRQFLDVWAKDQKDRMELADALRVLNKAIDRLELNMHGDGDAMMSNLKNVREAFNAIPPKWFHR